MGASLLYEVVKPTKTRSFDRGTSDFRNAIERVFGSFPCVLTTENLPMLKAMREAAGPGGAELWQQIINVLQPLHDAGGEPSRIKIWVEH